MSYIGIGIEVLKYAVYLTIVLVIVKMLWSPAIYVLKTLKTGMDELRKRIHKKESK